MKYRAVLLLVGFLLIFSQTLVFAQEFSADVINTSKAGTFNGKIYSVKDKVRMDFPYGATITRLDKNVVWVLMPEQKMYMEQSVDPKSLTAVCEKLPWETERIDMGTEMVDGRMATKYKITNTIEGVKQTFYQWVDKELQLTVKTQAEDKSWTMEFKNLKKGVQDPSVFEIPVGYKKFAIPKIGDFSLPLSY